MPGDKRPPSDHDRMELLDRIGEGKPVECRTGTVLIVEDEAGVRELTHRVLAQQGHRIIEAAKSAVTSLSFICRAIRGTRSPSEV